MHARLKTQKKGPRTRANPQQKKLPGTDATRLRRIDPCDGEGRPLQPAVLLEPKRSEDRQPQAALKG